MLRGIYTAASGMLLHEIKADSIANNLANATTHGFKRQSVVTRPFPEIFLHRIRDSASRPVGPAPQSVPIGTLGTGAALEALPLDMTPGPLRYTGQRLDLAIVGPGFFTVQLPTGDLAYTRHGAFSLDEEGVLVNHDGFPLVGTGGQPFVVEGNDVHIDTDGVVWIDGAQAGQLAVAEFEAPYALERMGQNLLLPTDDSGPAVPAQQSHIESEHLEGANVNVVSEMVSLVASQRAYEASQRMIQIQDETLGRLINE